MKRPQNFGRRLAIVGGVTTLAGSISWLLTGRNQFKVKTMTVNIPFTGKIELETNATQRQAAWSLYVELATRIASQSLAEQQGLLREALTSLYRIFSITREVLKQAGPSVGIEKNSVGGIAIAVLNEGIRPFLAKWHPKLQDWEAKCPSGTSQLEHERNWPEREQCRAELEQLRQNLNQYIEALATIAQAE